MTVFVLVIYALFKNYKRSSLAAKPVTFNEFKKAINSLLEFSATSELSKNKNTC
jgi:hypothetical protein